jgi:hypothetical protein
LNSSDQRLKLLKVIAYKFLKKMGNGMNRILDGVFVGSIRDSRDKEQITKFNITHILTIHEDPREGGLEVYIYIYK